ncbi:iron dicitrate transport regulator FecR [Ruegeria sp. HKCCD5849]|nr:FecR domain-containing protein [Ruegeria sp. HKCCD5849]NOD45757.1 iron dicitrate transport regulator FecR [Ruegeria sp. HKCCD5849]NOD50943.1 iron dicitrate transport regulator FecR [Ruegeria sp. HKCCD5851]NOD67750.1 iron dicitrate transport regulator FecR [Ruegeria sp. HKCCD7303]
MPLQAVANIGKVISAKQGAQLVREGKTQPVVSGMDVESGDAITTDQTGLIQIVFVDDTKIAIGPNARMVLDVSLLRGNRKAKSFAVQALGGSFRFISGKSRKRAYSITTPSATMAVRGTTFDMWVVSEQQSAMLVLEGTVRMCGVQGTCRSSGRQCSMYATSGSGAVGRPASQAQYEQALQSGFPFIQSQEGLLPPLQVRVEGCAGEAAPIRRVKPNRAEPRDAPPQRRERTDTVDATPASSPSTSGQSEPERPEPEQEEPEREEPEQEEPEREEPEREEPEREEIDHEEPEREEPDHETTDRTGSEEGFSTNVFD